MNKRTNHPKTKWYEQAFTWNRNFQRYEKKYDFNCHTCKELFRVYVFIIPVKWTKNRLNDEKKIDIKFYCTTIDNGVDTYNIKNTNIREWSEIDDDSNVWDIVEKIFKELLIVEEKCFLCV